MQVSQAAHPFKTTRSPTLAPAMSSRHFSQVLAARDTATDRSAMPRSDLALQTAQELVATALVQPLLAQLRNDPLKTELFHGGQAEEIFGQQLDTILADRLVQGTALPVVDAVHRHLLRRSAWQQGQRSDAGPRQGVLDRLG